MNDLDEIKREIKDRISIEELIGRYIRVERSGRNGFKALCPFHNDSKPSLSIVPDKQFYHCFTCGAGGDIFKFVVDYEGIPFGEALKKLAHEAGVELKAGDKKKRDRLEQLFDVMKDSHIYYKSNILNPIVKEYLKERNIDLEWAKEFGIGYATSSWEALKTYLLSRGASLKVIKELGLISDSKNGKTFDKFRNRMLLPFRNDSGYVVGYTGRIIESQEDKESDFVAAKYMNSPETAIYHKSKVLFGFYKSKDAIRESKTVILVEGNLDFISLYYRGVKNVVAISGTAFSDEQAKKIKRLADNAILMLDSDSAGQKASLKMVGILLNSNLNVEGVSLPKGEDPDSYIQKIGTDNFKKFIKDKKVNFLEYQKNIYDQQYPKGLPSEVKIDLIKQVNDISDFVKDEMKKINLKYEMKRLLNIGENELNEYLTVLDKQAKINLKKSKSNFKNSNKNYSHDNYYSSIANSQNSEDNIGAFRNNSEITSINSNDITSFEEHHLDEDRDYLATYITFLLKYPEKIAIFRDEVKLSDLGHGWDEMFFILFELFNTDDNKHIENDYIAKVLESKIPKYYVNKFIEKQRLNEFKYLDNLKKLISERTNIVDDSGPLSIIVAQANEQSREREIKKLEESGKITFKNIIRDIIKKRSKKKRR